MEAFILTTIKNLGSVSLLLALLSCAWVAMAVGQETVDWTLLPEWRVDNSSMGRTLLLSDCPEMAGSDGILYQDKVQGKVRLFFYHVNASGHPQKMDVLLENQGSTVAHIVVTRYGFVDPGREWLEVGKKTLVAYLAGSPEYSFDIPPGQSVPLSGKIGDAMVMQNTLVHGIFDFTASQPVEVKTMLLPIFEDSVTFAQTATVLPPDDAHLRGTFAGADRQLTPSMSYNGERDGPVAITLADNGIDRYLEGTDATDGSKVVNYGNYGVMYRIAFPSQKGGYFTCSLVPLGGAYAGAVVVRPEEQNWGPLEIPRGKVYFGGYGTNDHGFLGTFEGGAALTFTFSPPGGSNLPIRMAFVPQ